MGWEGTGWDDNSPFVHCLTARRGAGPLLEMAVSALCNGSQEEPGVGPCCPVRRPLRCSKSPTFPTPQQYRSKRVYLSHCNHKCMHTQSQFIVMTWYSLTGISNAAPVVHNGQLQYPDHDSRSLTSSNLQSHSPLHSRLDGGAGLLLGERREAQVWLHDLEVREELLGQLVVDRRVHDHVITGDLSFVSA